MRTAATHPASGIALILTLSILVIATILVVGFVASMRTERQASASMAHNENAKVVAQACLDHAISLLDSNIPPPLAPGIPPAPTNWVINPGRLTLISSGSSASTTVVPLHSGEAAIGGTDPNLNGVHLDRAVHYILGTNAAPMRVAWINVVNDPSQSASTANPLASRYAFWIDDENSKINVNTAYGKPFPDPLPPPAPVPGNTDGRYTLGTPPLTISGRIYTLGHPSSVDLSVLPGLDVASMRNVTSTRSLSSLDGIKPFVVSPASPQGFIDANKFFLTHFNADPEFNSFGKSRIFFADAMSFSHDYTNTTVPNPNWDTGYAYRSEPTTSGIVVDDTEPLIFHSQLMQDWGSAGYDRAGGTPGSDLPSSNPAVAAVHRIANYLNTPWPGYTQSFAGKFGVRETEQIAWNIYGVVAASTAVNTTTTIGAWANTTYRTSYGPPNNMRWSSFLWDGPLGSGARILPQTRSPLITKVGVGASLAQRGTGSGNPYMINPANGKKLNEAPNAPSSLYGVNFTIAFEFHLPAAYQGFHSVSSGNGVGWALNNNSRVYVVHLEANINGQKVVLASTTDKSAMAYSINGDDAKMVINAGNVPALNPNAVSNDGDRRVNALGVGGDLSTGDPASTGSTFVERLWDATTTPVTTISDIRIRFVATTPSTNAGSSTAWDRIPYQISPIRDIDSALGFEVSDESDPAKHGAIRLPGTISVDSTLGYKGPSLGGPKVWAVMETIDPRINQLASDWQQSDPLNYGSLSGNTILGTRTLPTYPASTPDGDESKLAFPDSSQFTVSGVFPTHRGGRPHDTDKRMSSVGWLSCVSTGMQSGVPWRTLKFQPGGGGDPPDWLLMDLFAVPFNELPRIDTSTNTNYQYPFLSDPSTNARFSALGLPSSLTYMNSTAGKININAKIFPDAATNGDFTPPARLLPLQAVFENMYRGTTQVSSTSGVAGFNSKKMAEDVLAYTTSNGPFAYSGQICEVPGVADAGATEWEKEAIIRNLGSLITTRSNAFSVWGIAQTIKKTPGNLTGSRASPGDFQPGDQVTSEKRFHAVVERFVWPGADGLAGNASNAGGTYDRLGTDSWLASPTNIVDGQDPTAPNFELSLNPRAAVIKYRLRFFQYLDE